MSLTFIQTIQYGLEIPCIAVKLLVKLLKHSRINRALLLIEETGSEIIVDFRMNRFESERSGALVERTLGRTEHLCHQVHFAAREDEVSIVDKLNV